MFTETTARKAFRHDSYEPLLDSLGIDCPSPKSHPLALNLPSHASHYPSAAANSKAIVGCFSLDSLLLGGGRGRLATCLSGRGRGPGQEPHPYRHPLSPCASKRWNPGRLRWRPGDETPPPGDGGPKSIAPVATSKDSPIKQGPSAGRSYLLPTKAGKDHAPGSKCRGRVPYLPEVISEPVSDGSGSVPNTSQMNCDATDNELR